jgi:membrane protease YdiL (CAAX protease family)
MEELLQRIPVPVLLVVPPIAEELFFRGFFLSGLRRGTNRWVAIVVTAIAFAIFHLEPAKYLTTGLLGIWLGYLVVSTGSLYPAILAHLINNSLPILFPGALFGGHPPIWAAALAVAGLGAAIFLLRGGPVPERPAGRPDPG